MRWGRPQESLLLLASPATGCGAARHVRIDGPWSARRPTKTRAEQGRACSDKKASASAANCGTDKGRPTSGRAASVWKQRSVFAAF
eukprot:4051357-Alexandrium_andersonii.AAC.1